MGIGDQTPDRITFVDWHDLYNHVDNDDDAIIEELAYRGRWTAIASEAKQGKSTLLLALAVDATQRGHTVIYLDAEMGRGDVLERVSDWMQLKADDLAKLHYTDLPPKLDNGPGATILWNTIEQIAPDLVIIDGLNGVVNGAENDDTTWRDLYELAITHLKKRSIAIISADNMGHGTRQGPRGHSVKLDKADAVIVLKRTETGLKLTSTHRRSSSYPAEQEYSVTDASEAGPPMKVTRVNVGTGTPPRTKEICRILDGLDAPADISRRKARELLVDNDIDVPGNADFGAMLKWRRNQTQFNTNGPRTTLDHSGPPLKVVQTGLDHSDKTPASGVVQTGGPTHGPPPVNGPRTTGPDLVLNSHIPTAEEAGL